MIAEQPSASRPVCPHCGEEYRPFQWTHPRACPNCGLLLGTVDAAAGGGPSRFWLALLAGGLAVLFGSGAIVQLAHERRGPGPRRGLPSAPAVGELRDEVFSADMDRRFDLRLEHLVQDLRRAPEDPFLLYAVTSTHLQRALCFRDTNPDMARQAVDRAREYLARVEIRAPHVASGLRRGCDDLNQLEWDRSGSVLGLNELWPFRTRFSEMLVGSSLYQSGGMGYAGDGAPYWMIGPYHVPAFVFRPYPGMEILPEERYSLDGHPVRMPRERMDRASLEARRAEWQPKLLRYVQDHPEDVRAADSVGTLLARAGVYNRFRRNASERDQEQGRLFLREAARIFEVAARKPQPRIYQAALHASSAECWRSLGEGQRAHAQWSKAVELAPYVPGFWQNLGKSAILLSFNEEGAEAYRKRDYWRLPGLMEARRYREYSERLSP